MKVSIVIPVYNNLEFLPQTIKSCLSQTYKDYEIIVVDDNSEQDIASYIKTFPNIKFHRNNENKGPAFSRNVGVDMASGDLISLIDSDDIMHKEKLSNSVPYFVENKNNIGMTCGNYCIFKNRNINKMSRPFYSFGVPIEINWNSLLRVNYVACGSVTFKKDVFLDVGRFNEKYWVAEDYDLWLRIAEKYRVQYIPKIMYFYSRIDNGNSLVNRNERHEFPNYRKEIIANSKLRMGKEN